MKNKNEKMETAEIFLFLVFLVVGIWRNLVIQNINSPMVSTLREKSD